MAPSIDITTKPLEGVIAEVQHCLELTPALVLGSGCSVPCGIPGMGDLQRHLEGTITPDVAVPEEVARWSEFKVALGAVGLEAALHKVTLPERLADKVVAETWRLIYDADVGVFRQVALNRQTLQLSRLYRHLFRSTKRTIDVITTNYDRLAEYAANAAGYSHYSGFGYGFISMRDMGYPSRIQTGEQQARTVNIWKVHGSLDWCKLPDGTIASLVMLADIIDDVEPQIVTPGLGKYEATHQEPFRTVLSKADQALMSANAFLCVGFGFNDTHIQPKLVERACRAGAHIVVLARHLTYRR